MTGKSAALYKKVFEYIENNIFKLNPSQFMTDYEAGMRKALQECFPGASIFGCWFHYSQSVYRQILSLKMKSLIENVEAAQIKYRMILSLPLLPSEHIEKAYNIIKGEAKSNGQYKNFEQFFVYYENFWLKLVCFVLFYFDLFSYSYIYMHGKQRETAHR